MSMCGWGRRVPSPSWPILLVYRGGFPFGRPARIAFAMPMSACPSTRFSHDGRMSPLCEKGLLRGSPADVRRADGRRRRRYTTGATAHHLQQEYNRTPLSRLVQLHVRQVRKSGGEGDVVGGLLARRHHLGDAVPASSPPCSVDTPTIARGQRARQFLTLLLWSCT